MSTEPSAIKVLVVDDDEDILRMAVRYLQSHGIDTRSASSPFGVSTTVKRERPDVVVLDVMMPALSGDQLARLLGSFDEALRIILYSAMDEAELAQVARGITNATYVPKPAGLEALHAAILNAARRD